MATSFTTEDVFSDIINTTISVVSRADVMAAVIMSFVFAITHMADFKAGPIGAILANHDSALAKFLTTNSHKLVGLVIFLPTIVASGKKLLPMLFLTTLVIFISPAMIVYMYAIGSYMTLMFTKSRRSLTRVVVVVVFMALVYFNDKFKWAEKDVAHAPQQRTTG